MDTVIDTAVALVTTAILTGTWAIARKRYKLLNQRDALLAEVQQTLVAVRNDNRCQNQKTGINIKLLIYNKMSYCKYEGD